MHNATYLLVPGSACPNAIRTSQLGAMTNSPKCARTETMAASQSFLEPKYPGMTNCPYGSTLAVSHDLGLQPECGAL